MTLLIVGALAAGSVLATEIHQDGDWDGILPIDIKRVPFKLRKGLREYEVKALLRVARAYENGDGVPKDLNFATKWYERAEFFESPTAKAWIKKGMEHEEIPALVFRKGLDLQRDPDAETHKKGSALIRKAADAGYPDAEMDLGLTHYEGTDLPKDMDAAVRYLKQAAVYGENVNNNHVTFGTLGRIYDDEKSEYYNPEQAYYFLLIATKLFPGYYTARRVKEYDKLTPEQEAAIKKRAANWKAGMPLWEAGRE
jgi:hypothetical protein